MCSFFFFNDTATTEIYTLSLHDALPISTTHDIREREWTVAPIRPDLLERRVEITGPVDRKMMINAFNSGANVFMADFEDSNAPTWENNVVGQQNLRDAVAGTIGYVSRSGEHTSELSHSQISYALF